MFIKCSNIYILYYNRSPKVINKHSKVFGEIPKGLPHVVDHENAIHFQTVSVIPNIRP